MCVYVYNRGVTIHRYIDTMYDDTMYDDTMYDDTMYDDTMHLCHS